MGGTPEPLPAGALGARFGATSPPLKAGLAPSNSRTAAEMAAVSFDAQPTAANLMF